jgi:2'-5' RNA ligase
MARIRTFVALDIPDDVRARAADLIEKLRASEANVGWVAGDRMHLTLKFLGDVPEQELAEVCGAVRGVCEQSSSFDMRLGRAGAFPNVERPRTIWLGVSEGAEPLETLQGQMEHALGELGFRRERRRYHGHLTLGRVRGGGPQQAVLRDLLMRYADFQTPHMLADEVLVLASYLNRSGPTYEVVGRCPLPV